MDPPLGERAKSRRGESGTRLEEIDTYNGPRALRGRAHSSTAPSAAELTSLT